ncbi:TPA: reductase [Enterobacter asburiae]|nr:reductase [Enterobacter asburiae]
MKKSCQLYKLLFCKGDDVMHCTINGAMRLCCTKLEHRFGALRLAQLTGRYLA